MEREEESNYVDEEDDHGEGELGQGTINLHVYEFERVQQAAATMQEQREVPSLPKSNFYVVVGVNVSFHGGGVSMCLR